METLPTRKRGDPVPLPVGQRLSLQRLMEPERGWRVAGYTYRRNGEWSGYRLAHADGSTTTASRFEALNLEDP